MRFLSFFLFLFLFAIPAIACECMPFEASSAKETYDEADIIAKVNVTQISPGWGAVGPILKINVIKIIKTNNDIDPIPENISVNYNENPEACGYEMLIPDQDYIFALYDTRNISLKNSNTRGYGYRLMNSCALDQIKYHLNQLKIDNKKGN